MGELPLSDFYETPIHEERQPIWTPKKRFGLMPESVDSRPKGSCEFVGAHIYEGSAGRKCTLSGQGSCFSFDNPILFAVCPTRNDKLKGV